MSHALRANRDQMFLLPPSLDDWVGAEHPVRFVRDLVDELDVERLGFRESPGEEGRPHYASELLLAVWLYGWMERIRSSRGLEKACLRDVAFLWLTGNHHPDHNTLWRFFRDNKAALRGVFKKVVQVAVRSGLVGFALHALDGTKIAAASSMETALHRKSLQEQLNKLDELIAAQMEQVERTEAEEQDGYAMPTTMQDLQARKRQIREALGQLEQADTAHLHRKEPEARVMKSRQGQTLAYNAQAVVDHDSDLIVAAEVCNDETDHAQLIPMLDSTQQTAGQVAEQTVADTGYYGGEPIAEAQKRKLPVIVRMQDESGTKGEFNKSHFRYDAGRDGYVCPRGELLQHEATHAPTTGKAYPMQVYRCRNRECPAQSQCTTDPKGRSIKRTPYEGALSLQAEKQKNWAMQQLLSLRKEIVEHIFGLLKAIDGFRRFTVRGLEGARTQWALACTALNLRKLWRFHTQRRLRLQAA